MNAIGIFEPGELVVNLNDDQSERQFTFDPTKMFVIACTDVVVGERARKTFDPTRLQSLADSIENRTQLQPIVLNPDNTLHAGGRRLVAIRDILKWPTILAIYREAISELDAALMELEENTEHEPFTWQEEVALTRKIHLLVAKQAGKKPNLQRTAEVTKISKTVLGDNLQLANEVLRQNGDILAIKTKTGALRALSFQKERKVMQELGQRALKEKAFDSRHTILHADCLLHLPTIPSETYDLILTDPIWGVEAGANIQNPSRNLKHSSHFDDSPERLAEMIPTLAEEFYRVAKSDAFLLIFMAQDFFPVWDVSLSDAGFLVRNRPLIWYKEQGGVTEMSLNLMPAYEIILLAQKGSKPLSKFSMDVFSFPRPPRDERLVFSQKPLPLLMELIEIFSVPGDRMLDPMCGSGSGIAAAVVSGRFADGIEIDENISKLAGFYVQKVIDEMTNVGGGEGE